MEPEDLTSGTTTLRVSGKGVFLIGLDEARVGAIDADEVSNTVRSTVEQAVSSDGKLLPQGREDLLDLARILQGKFQLAVGPVEMVRVVESALESMRPAAEAKGVRLQCMLDSHATIVGDAERLQQIAWWDWNPPQIDAALADFRALSAVEFTEKYGG